MAQQDDDPVQFTPSEKFKLMAKEYEHEQVTLTPARRNKLLRRFIREIKTNNYYVVKGTLWELLKYVVSNSPDGVEKWMSVRWLMSELAKYAFDDYGKEIVGGRVPDRTE